MADSDDEYDRKRRDKFRGERSGTGATESNNYRGNDRREERSRGRDDWNERDNWQSRSRGARSGPDYREYRGGNSRGYSPIRGEGPPSKRMRSDWPMEDRRYGGIPHDSYGYGGWGHEHYGHHPPHPGYGNHNVPPAPARDGGPPSAAAGDTQPAMMTFKTFLAAQEDSITVDNAIKKYNDYKQEFRRQQLNEFFVTHKDEEWFKIKYHPEESVKRKEEQQTALKSRLNVFLELLESGELAQITVDMDQQERLIRLLDTVVIKLEGGSEDDLKGLEEASVTQVVLQNSEKDNAEKAVVTVDLIQVIHDLDKECEEKKTEDEPQPLQEPKVESEKAPPLTMDIDPHHVELIEQAKMFSRFNVGAEPEALVQATQHQDHTSKATKQKRISSAASRSGSSSSTGSSSSSSSSSSEDEGESAVGAKGIESESAEGAKRSPEQPAPPGHTDEQPVSSTAPEHDKKTREKDEKLQPSSPAVKTGHIDSRENETNSDDRAPPVTKEEPPQRALHKTTSIFLRNLSPTITRAEVEAMCKRYGGFLRVALADPLPERRWFRRGWVTFRREVNIKDICWNLNNIRLRDCELGAIVNRDLMRRIRPVTGVALHCAVVRADARLAARLAHHLDARAGLWDRHTLTEEENGQLQNFSLNSSNPVLHKITEHLIEEESAEEEELLGLNRVASSDKANSGAELELATEPVERDDMLTAVLDKLILYLRIVHSVDYYNHCEYPYEDEMPNRCGIMHARAAAPAKVQMNEIADYIKSFESKMCAFLSDAGSLTGEELAQLGIKDAEAEVEKFIAANTQELAKDKWLCPLSGKKFKGPDFIRKHIFNKHGEKVEEVRKEVEYFNNYLRDVKRPQLAEHPSSTGTGTNPGPLRRDVSTLGHHGITGAPGGRGGVGGGAFGFGAAPYYAHVHPYAPYAPPHVHQPRHMRTFARGRGGGGADFRPIVHYRDLDAPREAEDFT